MDSIKCVVLGNATVGKTCLMMAYSTNRFLTQYVPTVYETYTAEIRVEGRPVHLDLRDTSGHEQYVTVPPLVYPDTGVFLICFSIVDPASFEQVRLNWHPSARNFSDAPIILVGTKLDLRNDRETVENLKRNKLVPIKKSDGRKLKGDIGAVEYVECSSLTRKGLSKVFDQAAKAVLHPKTERTERKCAIM